MGKHRPGTKGFIKEIKDSKGVAYLVGAEDVSDKERPYQGPVARVTWDETWLHITTDDYEGAAMLNIEALESLRKALAKIARSIKIKAARPS